MLSKLKKTRQNLKKVLKMTRSSYRMVIKKESKSQEKKVSSHIIVKNRYPSGRKTMKRERLRLMVQKVIIIKLISKSRRLKRILLVIRLDKWME